MKSVYLPGKHKGPFSALTQSKKMIYSQIHKGSVYFDRHIKGRYNLLCSQAHKGTEYFLK